MKLFSRQGHEAVLKVASVSLPYTGVGNLNVTAIVLVILAGFGINTRYHKVHALEEKDQEHPGKVGRGQGGRRCREKRRSKDMVDFSFSDVAVRGLLVVRWLGLVERPGVLPPPQASHAHENHDDGDQDHDGNHVADHVAAGALDVVVKFSALHTAVARTVVVGSAQVLVADGLLAVQVSTTALTAVAIVDDTLLSVSEHQATSRALPLV